MALVESEVAEAATNLAGVVIVVPTATTVTTGVVAVRIPTPLYYVTRHII